MRQWWTYNPPRKNDKLDNFMMEIANRPTSGLDCLPNNVDRVCVEEALRILEDQIKDYSVKFHTFGSYETGLMRRDHSMIDCYVSVKKLDRSETTFAEKLKVLAALPLKNLTPLESTFFGYTAELSHKDFQLKIFMAFDRHAQTSVLSSVSSHILDVHSSFKRLLALYQHLSPATSILSRFFREWAQVVQSIPTDEWWMSLGNGLFQPPSRRE